MLNDKNQPMEMGDIFNHSFNLLKSVFTKAIIFSAVFIVPATAIAYAMFFSFSSPDRKPPENSADQTSVLLNVVYAFYFALVPLLTASIIIQSGIYTLAHNRFNGNRISLDEMLKSALSKSFWRILLMYVCILIPCLVIFILVSVILGVLVSFSGIEKPVSSFLVLLPSVVLIIYLGISWTYGKLIIVTENLPATKALGRSFAMVARNWWRTFGRIAIFSLIIGLASSIISLPAAFFLAGNEVLATLPKPGEVNIEKSVLYITALFQMLVISMAIQIFISSILSPIYEFVTFYDLRIRWRDLPEEETVEMEQSENNLIIDGATDLETVPDEKDNGSSVT